MSKVGDAAAAKAEKAAEKRDERVAADRAAEEAKQAGVAKAVFDATHDKDGDPVPIEVAGVNVIQP